MKRTKVRRWRGSIAISAVTMLAAVLTTVGCEPESTPQDGCVLDSEGQCELAQELQAAELEDRDDKVTQPKLYPADPWLEADKMTAEDGVPRVPVWNALGLQLVPYQLTEGRVIVGGDVDLGPEEEILRSRDRGVALSETWFADGNIPWFMNDITEASTESRIEWAVDFLEERTPLNFTEVSSSSSLRKLEFRGTNSSSYGGMTYDYWDPDDPEPVLRLSERSGAASKGTILHELGHALGFPHEFQRPDRDDFVDICFNLDPFNYSKMGSGWWSGQDPQLLSPFDFASIMNSGYSGCVTPLSGFSWEDPIYGGDDQRVSVHDINSIYRVYADALNEHDDDTRMGEASAVGDFDDDGYEDVAIVSVERYSSSFAYIYVNFFRGVETDESEGGAGRAYMPWFRDYLTYTYDPDVQVAAVAGDFNGDGIADVAVGDPSYSNNSGRVAILTVNTPSRFGSADGPWGGKYVEDTDWIYATDVGLASGMSHKFGAALAAGNLTTSSYDDLVVGAPIAKQGTGMLISKTGGAVAHLKGADPSMSAVTWNPGFGVIHSYSRFGASVTIVPDLCLSGGSRYDVFAVGIPGYNSAAGAIHLYGCARTSGGSATTPTMLAERTYSQDDAEYGYAVQGFTVYNPYSGARSHYIAASAPFRDVSGLSDVGSVYLDQFEEDGTRTYITSYTPGTRYGDDHFGTSLAVYQYEAIGITAQDWTRLAIGMPGTQYGGVTTGKVYLWNPWVGGSLSSTATVLLPGSTHSGMRYGENLTTIVNDHSGYGFVIGSPGDTRGGHGDAGRADVRLNQNTGVTTWSSDTHKLDLATTGDKRPDNL